MKSGEWFIDVGSGVFRRVKRVARAEADAHVNQHLPHGKCWRTVPLKDLYMVFDVQFSFVPRGDR